MSQSLAITALFSPPGRAIAMLTHALMSHLRSLLPTVSTTRSAYLRHASYLRTKAASEADPICAAAYIDAARQLEDLVRQ